jgi:hypothetical protein
MTAKLCPPECDKGYSLQFFGEVGKNRNQVLSAMYGAKKHCKCNPFLQGDQPEWAMIEFWTDDMSEIEKAIQFFSNFLKISVDRS